MRLLSPITPHLAEQLGEGKFRGLVAEETFPSPDEFPRSLEAERRESFLERLEDDVRAVLRPREERGEPAPGEVIVFVASPWKRTVERWMREELARGAEPTVRAVMERAGAHDEVAAYRGEIPRYVQRVAPQLRGEPSEEPPLDEVAVLRSAEGYLVRRFGASSVTVHREEEGAPHDPLGRRERARPGRPAFYLVGVTAAPKRPVSSGGGVPASDGSAGPSA